MKALKEQIERFIGGHCHFPDHNEPRFTEDLLSLLETAMRDAHDNGAKYGSKWSDVNFNEYFSQIKETLNK